MAAPGAILAVLASALLLLQSSLALSLQKTEAKVDIGGDAR